MRLILASASPARLRALQAAGLRPEVIVSGVDESGVEAPTIPALVAELARRKAGAVAATLASGVEDTLVIGCDSMLELEGRPHGRPADAAQAIARWRLMRGRVGTLHTGHHLVLRRAGATERSTDVASTRVHFATLDDAEIEAYVGTGEPLRVAGAFTIDGLGGAFVSAIEGDPHNVVGISLSLLRSMLARLEIRWTDLW